MTAHILSAAPIGFDGRLIDVECDSSKGLPTMQIVGLGNKAIDEAKERVRSAITNSRFDFPARKFTVNLAPADLPKDGSHFDLPIALAILTVSGQLPPKAMKDTACAGELSLSGELRPVKGIITITETARAHGISTIIVPAANAAQAALIRDIHVIGATRLDDIYLHLVGEKKIMPTAPSLTTGHNLTPLIDMADIVGQDQAKRAMVIAAAGHHNILLNGPPGAGKTMLAKALHGVLPLPTYPEMIEITKLHNLAGEALDQIVMTRPFRTPHHTSSFISLVGGGVKAQPGEISLAHHGVLFLDELPEYPRISLEALRQPLEDRMISISRAAHKVTYPANFMLVATKNPCQCGYLGDMKRECSCTMSQLLAYQKRVSGPLLDRIDLTLTVKRVDEATLTTPIDSSPTSASFQQQIAAARQLQHDRYSEGRTNASLSSKEIRLHAQLSPAATRLLARAVDTFHLSTRGYFKVMRLARTIADLENASVISDAAIAEALQYRHETTGSVLG